MAINRSRGHDVGPTGEAVATNIARIRKTEGISLREMEDRLTTVGRRITISGLSKIENGDRRVDVDDLMAIAVALDVSPATLLLPRAQPSDVVDVTGRRASTLLFWQWVLASDNISGDQDAFLERSLPSWVTGVELDTRMRQKVVELYASAPGSDETKLVGRIETMNPED